MAGDNGLAARVPARLTREEGRSFGTVVGGAFIALAAILYWRDRQALSVTLAGLGSALVLAGLLVPTFLGPVRDAWMKLAHAISKVTTPIFMGVVFFVVITPAGLLARAFGHRSLVRKAGTSAWVDRPPTDRRSNLERQF